MICRAAVLRAVLSIAVTVTLVPSLNAQSAGPPDLSGTWSLNISKSKAPKKVTLDPETLTIQRAGDSIAITISGDKNGPEMYVIDGKEHIKELGRGAQNYTKAQWKNGVLLTESGGRVVGFGMGEFPVITNKDRWSLSADGLTLTREDSSGDASGTISKVVFVYDKK
jgi:hypothetical protein